MNNYHSSRESFYKNRLIAPNIKAAIKTFPVVIITGARQVGKSTLLKKEFSDFRYIDFDDFSHLQQARREPASLWIGSDRVIIDEAHKAPEIFSAIKLTVDTKGKGKRFILSGSSNILLMKRISETLAGRAVYFEMYPMTLSEMENGIESPQRFFELWDPALKIVASQLPDLDAVPLMLKGFMPSLLTITKRRDILLWWEGYVRTYLERDVRELTKIDSLIDFKRILDSIALRTGNVLNQTEVSRDTGISQPTVHRYLKILEVSNIICRVPAYFLNRTKRITKSPKLFFIDPGLCIYLSGYHDEESLRQSRELGNFFETMIFMHIKIFSELMTPKAKMFYWRTTDGKEVDFVLEHGKKLLAFEAKMTQNPSFNDAKNLLTFIENYPQTIRCYLLHCGASVKWLHSKILAIPWWWAFQPSTWMNTSSITKAITRYE